MKRRQRQAWNWWVIIGYFCSVSPMGILQFLLAGIQDTYRVWYKVSFSACCVKFAMSYNPFKPASGTLPMQELSWTGYSTSCKPCTDYERLFPCLFSWVTCLILSADLSFLEVISNKLGNGIQTGYQFTLHGCHNSIWLVNSFFFFYFKRHANVGSKFPIAWICSK